LNVSFAAGECQLCSRIDGLQRVELGPSFIPNADIARNVCYPRTDQSQIGQLRPVAVTAQFAHNRTFGADWT
jgi:hypothetical protein